MNRRISPAMIALVALLIALTTILTGWTVRVPVPATQGYFNLSDVPITFISLVFGPWVGLVAGGVGAALADLFGGYAFFAPITLVAHGVEGLLIGLLGRGRRSVPGMILAWVPGALAMVLIYFLAEGVLKGWPAALVEVPVNLSQGLLGVIVGIPLVLAVRRAYPPVDQIGRRRTWTE
ncbi:MAG: ECF transporter S component [Chloroflexi bacterium]|nr:ECF transporter S component [Chloroflexota bacterium]